MVLLILLGVTVLLLLRGKLQEKIEVAKAGAEEQPEPQQIKTEIKVERFDCRHLLVRLLYQDVYETGSVAVDFSAYGEDEGILGFTSFIKGAPPSEFEEDINGQYCDVGPGCIMKITDSLSGQVAWDFLGGCELL